MVPFTFVYIFVHIFRIRFCKLLFYIYSLTPRISLNLSPVQFREGGIAVDEWMAYLDKLGFPPQSVVVEVTEQLLAGMDASVSGQLEALHRQGVKVAIDDFGTGYSSLASLKKFSPDT